MKRSTFFGILLMIIGTISGGLTMNPIILGVINGVGILLTNFGKMEKLYKESRNDIHRVYHL